MGSQSKKLDLRKVAGRCPRCRRLISGHARGGVVILRRHKRTPGAWFDAGDGWCPGREGTLESA